MTIVIVLISEHSDKVVSAEIGQNTNLGAVVDELIIGEDAWANFEMICQGGNGVALKSIFSDKYV